MALLLLCASAIGTSSAAPLELPPLVQPPSQERHPGKVIWVDLVTTDLAGAERFYGGLFGWTFEDLSTRRRPCAVAILDGVPVGGLVQQQLDPRQRRHPVWLTFLSVADVDAVARTVAARGGKVLSTPRTHVQRGRQAVFSDPQGAVFAALQSSSGDPPDVMPEPGQWIWSSLVTTDPNQAAAFYQAVFGYEVFDPASDDGVEHFLLASDDYARASANALPPGASNAHPHWLNFVRVANAAESAAKAAALGGRVLVAAHRDRHDGAIAVVADPQGAPFGLLEWDRAPATGATR